MLIGSVENSGFHTEYANQSLELYWHMPEYVEGCDGHYKAVDTLGDMLAVRCLETRAEDRFIVAVTGGLESEVWG